MKISRPGYRFVLAIVISELFVAAAAADDISKLYTRKATWPETMLAVRAKLAGRPESKPVEFGPWHTTGPLSAKDLGEALFPEQGVDLGAKGPDGKLLWQQQGELADGQTHNLPGGGGISTYLTRTITVSESATVSAGFGSDDGMEVWLNGKKLISHRGPVSANGEKADLGLKAGENQLLLKIHNTGGSYSFFFAAGEQTADAAAELWAKIEEDFPLQTGWMKQHLPNNTHLSWFDAAADTAIERKLIEQAIGSLGRDGRWMQGRYEQLVAAETPADDAKWLALYERVNLFRHRPTELKQINVGALRLAVEDLVKTFGNRYRRGQDYLKEIDEFERRVAEIETALARGDNSAKGRIAGLIEHFRRLQQEALLDNPLMDFENLMLIRRKAAGRLGLPQNWQGNCAIGKTGYDNQIAVLSPPRPGGRLSTLFKPDNDEFVGDVDLHFDADKMLFSMPGSHNRWQIWEIGVDGKDLRQVTPGEHPDVDNYDACYLPDGRIIFGSTRCFQGIPCVGGGNTVANLCIMNPDGTGIRQLCFDQDHNWCPTVLNNGRVLYARWEYSDTPHYFTRLLFHMNPDGTDQKEYYASNSPWPNSTFYARPIPGHPTMIAGVISGHHGVPRMGEMILFDPARGRHQADGVVQRIPGYGIKVKPNIGDGIVNGSWPKFLHPFPLSEKYYLVSMQPTSKSLWGIYLVDVFDNMVLIREEPGYVMFEPVPLRPTRKPPCRPDHVNLASKEAVVYMTDVYFGPGLKGVPRGTVKKLRILEPHYAYPRMGGHISIGIDGPWDVHRIIGTVPVERDGSASFRVPANTPLAVQPLDEKGRALQIMRSWLTAMPGEILSCVGCHEHQNTTPPSKSTLAARRAPSAIAPWYGPARGFSFKREVQPVLEKYCIGCHDGQHKERPNFVADRPSPFRNFDASYVALHPYVRRPGPESDYFLQKPLEFHASTSELVQMLEKGHHNVKLDAEAWDRLITWIDLNVPDHGTWHEHRRGHSPYEQRRLEMRTRYANVDCDPEAIDQPERPPVEFIKPAPEKPRKPQNVKAAGWPFDVAEAQRRQTAAGEPTELQIELAEAETLSLMLLPAGEFVIGSHDGQCDEYPAAKVRIEKPFYMGTFEITNAQYALFDPGHDSAYISMTNKDQSRRGHAVNGPRQPVVRVTWQRAMEFCQWLSKQTGHKFSLPTEAQWEWACRAGSAAPFCYGDLNTDFSKFANLADRRLDGFAHRDSPKWHPKDSRFDDGAMVTVDVGRYQPNAWGLHDMHGNVAEWTRTAYRPYPYDPRDGRDQPNATGEKSVRGGSWFDRPKRATAGFRMHYQPWQHVYNVGFRVVMEAN